MEIIRWMRVILSSIFILLGLGFGTYFYIKEHPTPIALEDCAVNFSTEGSSEFIKFGDRHCPS